MLIEAYQVEVYSSRRAGCSYKQGLPSSLVLREVCDSTVNECHYCHHTHYDQKLTLRWQEGAPDLEILFLMNNNLAIGVWEIHTICLFQFDFSPSVK